MRNYNSLFNADESTILKRGTFWNLVASILNSLMSAFLMFFITRINGVILAGIFSYASAIAYQCLSLGAFGVRNFHSSDVRKEFSFSDYINHRVISSILMYTLLIYYAFGKGYSLEKAMIIFTFGLFKSIDAIEDVYHGEYQRNGRLDIGAKLQSIRYLLSLVVFVIGLWISHNLIVTCTIAFIASTLIFTIQNRKFITYFVKEKIHINWKRTMSLMILTMPICISNLINMYVVNAPKYAIDRNLSSEFQAYYGYLVMPVFTINLLSTVIYRPYISKMAENWQNDEIKNFNKQLIKQIIIIVVLTILITLFGYLLGLTLIEVLYGVKLHKYMMHFLILLLGGGLNTIAVFLSIVMTIQRDQNKIIIGYIVALFFSVFCSDFLIQKFHIMGASLLYFITSLLLTVIFVLVILIRYYNKIKLFQEGK